MFIHVPTDFISYFNIVEYIILVSQYFRFIFELCTVKIKNKETH